jgi:predicted ester cyclase
VKKLVPILLLSLMLLTLIIRVPATAQDNTSPEENKALLRLWFDIEAGRYYDRIDEFFTSDLVRHSTATEAVMPDVRIESRDAYLQFWKNNVAMFPDYYVSPLLLSAEGDLAAFYATFNGTYSENGNHVSIPMLGFVHFEGGLIDELWVEWDNLTWNTQMMNTSEEVVEVPLSSIDDLVGTWRVYGTGWAGFVEVNADGSERYFEPGCQGRLCTDTTQAIVENNQLFETGSSAYPHCDARYDGFVLMQGDQRIGLRLEPVGRDCYFERAEAYSHIIHFMGDN